jgi:hypothetical protein
LRAAARAAEASGRPHSRSVEPGTQAPVSRRDTSPADASPPASRRSCRRALPPRGAPPPVPSSGLPRSADESPRDVPLTLLESPAPAEQCPSLCLLPAPPSVASGAALRCRSAAAPVLAPKAAASALSAAAVCPCRRRCRTPGSGRWARLEMLGAVPTEREEPRDSALPSDEPRDRPLLPADASLTRSADGPLLHTEVSLPRTGAALTSDARPAGSASAAPSRRRVPAGAAASSAVRSLRRSLR